MPRTSAGILLYRRPGDAGLQLLIAHMGGPFWARKDERAWSIVKGEYDPQAEDPPVAARREFREETGQDAPDGDLLDLGEIRQSSGKTIRVYGLEGGLDPATLEPGTFTMEWPPRSGREQEFPEIDRVAWVDPDTARAKLVKGQAAFVDRLQDALRV